MKKLLKILLIVSCFFCLNVIAKEGINQDYTIDNFDVTVKVNKNNTYEVTERVKVNYNKKNISFKKIIPLVKEIKLDDGRLYKKKIRLRNSSLDSEYTTSSDDDFLVLKSAPNKNEKEHIYTIKYTYVNGKDSFNNKDELYYYIVDKNWSTSINNITFKIIMPKAFEQSGIRLLQNAVDIDENLIDYNVNDNIITGSYSGLDRNNSLMIRIPLENNYFLPSTMKFLNSPIITYLIPIIIICLSIVIWMKYGKSNGTPVIKDTPPKKLSIIEYSDIYYDELTKTAVISCIIDLANKGYLNIQPSKDSKFVLTKNKAYDGKNKYEKKLFEDIFNGTDEVDSKSITFLDAIDSILDNLERSKEKELKYIKKTSLIDKVLILLAAILPFSLNIISIFSYQLTSTINYFDIFFNIIYSLIVTSAYIFSLSIVISKGNNLIGRVVYFCIFLGTCVFVFEYFFFPTIIACAISSAVPLYLITKTNIRSEERQKVYDELEGYKMHLMNLDNVLNDEKFYEALPYIYLFKIQDTWYKKVKNQEFNLPKWFVSDENLEINDLQKVLNDMIKWIIYYK